MFEFNEDTKSNHNNFATWLTTFSQLFSFFSFLSSCCIKVVILMIIIIIIKNRFFFFLLLEICYLWFFFSKIVLVFSCLIDWFFKRKNHPEILLFAFLLEFLNLFVYLFVCLLLQLFLWVMDDKTIFSFRCMCEKSIHFEVLSWNFYGTWILLSIVVI